MQESLRIGGNDSIDNMRAPADNLCTEPQEHSTLISRGWAGQFSKECSNETQGKAIQCPFPELFALRFQCLI